MVDAERLMYRSYRITTCRLEGIWLSKIIKSWIIEVSKFNEHRLFLGKRRLARVAKSPPQLDWLIHWSISTEHQWANQNGVGVRRLLNDIFSRYLFTFDADRDKEEVIRERLPQRNASEQRNTKLPNSPLISSPHKSEILSNWHDRDAAVVSITTKIESEKKSN